MAAGSPPIWVVLRTQARADPRKTVILAVLAVVMLVVYVRMFWSGPTSQAEAELLPAVSSEVPTPAETPTVRAEDVPARIVLSQPLSRELTHDPFIGSAALRSISPSVGPQTPAAGLRNTKEGTPQQLELQSTICCDDPIAGINGRFLRPGDQIQGYVLERVNPTSAVLRKGDASLVLFLK